MKRLVIFIAIFFLTFVKCAPFIEFQNREFQPGETLLAEIKLEEGEFTKQISESDIKFSEGRKEIFFETKVTFYQGIHYLYTYLPREGNFTMKIQNILYKSSGTLWSEEITEQIYVKEAPIIEENNSFKEILSIKPGFTFLEKEPRVKVINVGNSSINFTIDYPNGSDEKVSLNPLNSKEFSFLISENLSFFKVESYKEFLIPIIYPRGEIFIPVTEKELKASHEIILMNLIIGEKAEEIINLFNFGDNYLTDLNVSSEIDFITFEELGNFSPRENKNFSVYFNPKNPGHFTGEIKIEYSFLNKSNLVNILLNLFVLPNGSEEEDFFISQKTCSELNGTVCTLEEYCNGNATFSKGGEYCCLAVCEKIETPKESSSMWLIGILILLALGLGGYFLYSKSKKVKQAKPEEKIKEISEKYVNKMKGV